MSNAETVLDTEITKSVDNSLTRKLKDIAAGFVGGATQVLIGQPADLVKIRLQTTSATSSFQVIKMLSRMKEFWLSTKDLASIIWGWCLCVPSILRIP